jgi:two-component system chemotaxis response regulator CheB
MIRVVVVEDSALFRRALCAALQSDPELHVVAEARNGREGVALVLQHRPDIVTMDVNMPLLNGYEAAEQIMALCPTPIVIVTGSPTKQEEQGIMRALSLGVLDVVAKPDLLRPQGQQQARELIDKLKILSKARVLRHLTGLFKRLNEEPAQTSAVPAYALHLTGLVQPPQEALPVPAPKPESWRVVAIASSTGGPAALARIVSLLPGDLGGAIVVAQHIAEGFTPMLVNWLDSLTPLKVVEAEAGAALIPGTMVVGPSGRHLQVNASGKLELLDTPAVHGCRPSGDVLLSSVARVFGSRAVGVILTGMGCDGTEGAQAIQRHGGLVYAQDESTCVIFGMPRSAIEAGAANRVLPLDNFSLEITRLLGRQESSACQDTPCR